MARAQPGSGRGQSRHAWTVALVILCCGAGLGCSRAPEDVGAGTERAASREQANTAGAGTDGATGSGGPAAEIRLPLDPYSLSLDEMRTVGWAHSVLVRACMARFGFRIPAPTSPAEALFGRHERRYGVLDTATAAKYGYQAPFETPASPNGPRNRPPATEAEIATLTGRGAKTVNGVRVPDGGCADEAGRALNPASDLSAAAGRQPLAIRLGLESYERSQRDARVVAVFRRWSACMQARGHRYADPMSVVADPRFDRGNSREQVATATADAVCKDRTGLVKVWSTVEAEYQRRQIRANRAELNRQRQAVQVQVRTASAVLAGTGTRP